MSERKSEQALLVRGYVAWSTVICLTTGRVADIATTLHFDPLLKHEQNPVVLALGGGIGSLIGSAVLVWLLCMTFLFAFWRGPALKLSYAPTSFRGFVGTWIRRVVNSRHSISETLPGGSHWNEGLQSIRLFALGLSWALICASTFAIHAWFARLDAPVGIYQQVYSVLRLGKISFFVYLMTPAGFLVGVIIFFSCEYRLARLLPSGGSRRLCD